MAAATTAGAQVACTTPDVLCTGDPCTIHDVQVLTPCLLDFGGRTVEINGRFRTRGSDLVFLSAGAFTVRKGATLNSSSNDPGGHATPITLSAAGNIVSNGRALLSGEGGGGTFQLLAGGTVVVTGNVIARGPDGVGGHVTIQGDAGVHIARFIDVRGDAAGSIALYSANGDVTIDDQLRAGGAGVHDGGSVLVDVGGNVAGNDRIIVVGHESAGSISISTTSSATAGDVTLTSKLDAKGKDLFGGNLHVALAPTGELSGRFLVDITGKQFGGSMCVEGGSVAADATVKAGDVLGFPGQVRFNAVGDLSLTGKIDVTRGDGVIEVQSTGNLTLAVNFDARDGCIAVSCGGTCNTAGSSFDVTPVADCPGTCP